MNRSLFVICSIIIVHCCVFTLAKASEGKYAYATIHYEGTERDEEYILGIRTLLRSIKATGTTHDILVLVTENVKDSSRRLFENEGAKIKQITSISNPYK